MLIGFKVKNFMSIKDLQQFSFLASDKIDSDSHVVKTNGLRVLRFSGMFGANASGKSNFMNALGIAQGVLTKGIKALINNLYYRGSEIQKDKPSYFEYELALDNKLFSYGFEIDISKREIVSEWLIDMTNKDNAVVLFERDVRNNEYKTDLKDTSEIFLNCLNEMKSSHAESFLKEVIRRVSMSGKLENFPREVINVYSFLTSGMIFIKPESHKLIDIDYDANEKEILRILGTLDINIDSISNEETTMEAIQSKLPEKVFDSLKNNLESLTVQLKKTYTCTLRVNNDLYAIKKQSDGTLTVNELRFTHKNSTSSFGAYEESDGTIRVLELVDILLSKNKLFLIDELDRSLHPTLMRGLLVDFLKSKNTNNQLLITTHELKTLDIESVRKDEIWFVEKSENGDSRIYSLDDFKDVDEFYGKFGEAYEEGRFGAVPNIPNINVEQVVNAI